MPKARDARSVALPPASIPSGTVTFLFTDIEGSTKRWEQHHDAMKAAVARHDAIVREAIESRDGFVFKTVGDAFCAAFDTSRTAIDAAIAAQLALHGEGFSEVGGLRVRMGIHAGTADERDGDYFGPGVNRTARLMSIGHGGQVLISSAVKALIADRPIDGASLVDLGLRRLKDLSLPERVWQVSIDGLSAVFPALSSLDARPNNLPIQTNALLGRDRDLVTLKSQLASQRLLTISGPGGVGKTRLALQAGADLIDRYAHGVWFVDLAPTSVGGLASSVVAQALDIRQSGDSADESILHSLKRREMLLILDNCEHLLDSIAPLAESILKRCSQVRILTTSRQPLGIAGEVVHRLPSLAVPDLTVTITAKDVNVYGATALFAARALAADTQFTLTDVTAPVVAAICRRLDGIPLAIELAAARVKVLSIPNLARRLDERFKILTGGNRTSLPRQKTLAALIEWSYNLLTAREQTFFNRLGIFAGSFSLGAATEICAGNSIDASDVLDLLSSLADKSLIIADTGGELERYRLLESTGAYATEKLISSGERERLARHHAEYFRDLVQAVNKRFNRESAFAWLACVEPELSNLRATLEWTLKQGNDPVVGGAIAGALDTFWSRGGLAVEGRYWIGAALKRVNESEQPRLAALLWTDLSLLLSGKPKYEAAERAQRLYDSVGDSLAAAQARRFASNALFQMGRLEEASDVNTQALATLRESGDKLGVALCLAQQAVIEEGRGDLRAGRDLNAQAISAFDALGYGESAAATRGNMAVLEFADGHPERALVLTNEALETHLRGKHATYIATGHINSAAYRIALGDLERARESAREGLRCARMVQDDQDIACGLQHLALLAALGGDVRRAAQVLGYVDARFKDLDLEREYTEKWSYDKLISSLRGQLGEAEIVSLGSEGAVWSEDRAVDEAIGS